MRHLIELSHSLENPSFDRNHLTLCAGNDISHSSCQAAPHHHHFGWFPGPGLKISQGTQRIVDAAGILLKLCGIDDVCACALYRGNGGSCHRTPPLSASKKSNAHVARCSVIFLRIRISLFLLSISPVVDEGRASGKINHRAGWCSMQTILWQLVMPIDMTAVIVHSRPNLSKLTDRHLRP